MPEMSKNDAFLYFDSLSREEQRKFCAELGERMKPLDFILKVPASIEEVALVLKYCEKHSIKHQVRRVKNKVHFIFNNHADRNNVLVGIRTL